MVYVDLYKWGLEGEVVRRAHDAQHCCGRQVVGVVGTAAEWWCQWHLLQQRLLLLVSESTLPWRCQHRQCPSPSPLSLMFPSRTPPGRPGALVRVQAQCPVHVATTQAHDACSMPAQHGAVDPAFRGVGCTCRGLDWLFAAQPAHRLATLLLRRVRWVGCPWWPSRQARTLCSMPAKT